MSKSILIVDEDPEILGFLTLMFEKRGVRVLRARTREEALEIAGRQYVPVDLVLTNMMMARTAGTDFAQEVSFLRGRPVPVLYMAAFVEAGLIRVEAMKRPDLSGGSAPDERGVVTAVLSAFEHGNYRTTAG